MEKLNQATFEKKVLNAQTPVVVDFNTAWCGPCKKLTPILEELQSEFTGKAIFFEVDASAEPNIAQQYDVMSIPTVILFSNGQPQERIVGLTAKDKIKTKINLLL